VGGAVLWLTRELLAKAGGFEGWYSTLGSLGSLTSQQARAATALFAAIAAAAWYVRRRIEGKDTEGPPAVPEESASVTDGDAKAVDAPEDAAVVKRSRRNPWPFVSFVLLMFAAYFAIAYPEGMSPVFWTLFAATGAGVLGWQRGKRVKRGRKRSVILSFVAAAATALSYSPSALTVGAMGQWQPFAEWAWSLGASPSVARDLGPSKGVRRSMERAARGDRDGALRAASDAVRARQDDADAWLLLAAYSLDARDYDRAYSEALRAQQLRPGSGIVLAAIGAILMERDRADLAMRALRSAVRSDPGSEAANLVYGCTLAQEETTQGVASQFLRRAAAAADGRQVTHEECMSPDKPYSSARWWAAALEHEYNARLRQASRRVAALPLPPMPGASNTRTREGTREGTRELAGSQGDV
jgi:Tfp pilus assembly protein PilF